MVTLAILLLVRVLLTIFLHFLSVVPRSLLFTEDFLHPLEDILTTLLDVIVLVIKDLGRSCACEHTVHLVVALLQRILCSALSLNCLLPTHLRERGSTPT